MFSKLKLAIGKILCRRSRKHTFKAGLLRSLRPEATDAQAEAGRA